MAYASPMQSRFINNFKTIFKVEIKALQSLKVTKLLLGTEVFNDL